MPNNRWSILTAFIMAGIVGGLYAVVFLQMNEKIRSVIVSKKISGTVEDFLRGMESK